MDSEFDLFVKAIADKSANTIKNYKTAYKKLMSIIGGGEGSNIATTDEKKIVKKIREKENNRNTQQSLINIAIMVKRMNDKKDIDILIQAREDNKKMIIKMVQAKNVSLQSSLPSYDEIQEYTDMLYEKGEWTDFIINFLLINYQVRNQDLVFDIVRFKRDTQDTDKNFMWLSNKKVVYSRNNYKTADTYGKKVITITDPKFVVAMKRTLSHQKYDEEKGVFIPTISQVGYYIKKATLKQIGEGAYMKIVVNKFRNNIDKIKEISENRGTDINTILTNYDIENTSS